MSSSLTHSPEEVVRKLLVDAALAVEPSYDANGVYSGSSWPAFHGNEPSTPDEVITVYNNQGLDQGRTMVDGEIISKPGIQLRIRARTKASGWTKGNALRVYLSESLYARNVTISGSTYRIHALVRFGQLLYLGTDTPATKRHLFTLNCMAAIRQLS